MFMNLETFQEPQDSSFFAGKVRNRNGFVKKGVKSDNFLKLNASERARLGNLASGYNGVVLEIAMEMEVCYTGSRKFTVSFLSEDMYT